jgi:SAM-dependent methyltransferase
MDPVADLKDKARITWAKGSYGEIARNLISMSAHLVASAGPIRGERVLDIASGTGITTITARLAGADVVGLDLTPELLAEAKRLEQAAGAEGIDWREGDAEALPFEDEAFDVVLSSFGHMFAPRPDVVSREMLRVLRPGGRIAFTTWPAEHATGVILKAVAVHVPPPAGIPSPLAWGDPQTVKERLGPGVKDIVFQRGVVRFYALGPAHVWTIFSTYYGPTIRAVEAVGPDKVAALRRDFITAIAPFVHDNVLHQDYLLTRAVKP